MTSENYFKINLKYLPIKAHYFFLYGGTGGTVPYMQVYAKEFGISSMAVGIIFTLVPLCVWISKPVFGFITDRFKYIRNILIILIIVTGLSFYFILHVPRLSARNTKSTNVTVLCDEQRDQQGFNLLENASFCDTEIKNREYECEFTSPYCLKNITLSGVLNITEGSPNNSTGTTSFFFKFHEKNISNKMCDCLQRNLSSLVCECNSFSTRKSEYTQYNFWVFVVLTIISGTASGTMWSLTDAACNEVLGDNSGEYGKQRLWATISWGVSTLASGYLNDLASHGSSYLDFSPGFYWMITFLAVDIIILGFYPIKKSHESMNICKDAWKIFSKSKTIIFAVGVYICGSLSGLLWTYHFWFLTDLGSSQLLLGLVAGVQCLLAEVPSFFISGWLVKKVGHFYCLIAALVAFALRVGLYSILHDPWWVLPIELLHGVTFAVFFAAMTLYAVNYAAPGTEATMLGIFGGIFEGLGVATGSFLGGLGFDLKGGRWTFFVASMISLCSVPILTLSNIFLSKSEGKLKFGADPTVPMKEIVKRTSQDPIR